MRTTNLALAATLAVAASAAAADLPAQGAATADVLQRAQILVARQSWADAAVAYKAAIAATPNDAVLHNRLGMCYQAMGDTKAARNAYRKAIELKQDYAEAYNNLGTLEHMRGKYKQAVRAYGQAIKSKPQDAVFFKNLGAAWLARGDAEKALEAWNEAIRLNPGIFETEAVRVAATNVDLARQYYLYAKLLAARGEVEKALGYLTKARAAGFDDFGKVERDRDFATLVGDPRYATIK